MISRLLAEGLASSILDACNQPLDLAWTIMEMRSYAAAKDLIDRAEKDSDIPDHPMVDMVFAVVDELAHEERERRRAKVAKDGRA